MSLPVPGRVAETVRRSTVQLPGGSGAVVGTERVITNAHVLRERDLWVESWEGNRLRSSLTKIDKLRDLAWLEVPGLNGTPLAFADSGVLRPGTPVFAVGNPLGFVGALSSGTVHRIGAMGSLQPLAIGESWICSDLRLAPGNSGGPLANFQGELVGINTLIAAGGLAFAISSRAVGRFLAKPSPRRELGVTLHPVVLRNRQPALLILEVAEGGSAQAASLLPGDILIAVDDHRIRAAGDLLNALESASGNLVELAFYRGGQHQLRRVKVHLQPPGVRAA